MFITYKYIREFGISRCDIKMKFIFVSVNVWICAPAASISFDTCTLVISVHVVYSELLIYLCTVIIPYAYHRYTFFICRYLSIVVSTCLFNYYYCSTRQFYICFSYHRQSTAYFHRLFLTSSMESRYSKTDRFVNNRFPCPSLRYPCSRVRYGNTSLTVAYVRAIRVRFASPAVSRQYLADNTSQRLDLANHHIVTTEHWCDKISRRQFLVCVGKLEIHPV